MLKDILYVFGLRQIENSGKNRNLWKISTEKEKIAFLLTWNKISTIFQTTQRETMAESVRTMHTLLLLHTQLTPRTQLQTTATNPRVTSQT